MASKQFRSALRRLRNGVPIYRKGCPFPAHARFNIEFSSGKWRGIIRGADSGEVIEIWEVPRLDWLRRIACGYYPAVAKAFGPARQYAGL